MAAHVVSKLNWLCGIMPKLQEVIVAQQQNMTIVTFGQNWESYGCARVVLCGGFFVRGCDDGCWSGAEQGIHGMCLFWQNSQSRICFYLLFLLLLHCLFLLRIGAVSYVSVAAADLHIGFDARVGVIGSA